MAYNRLHGSTVGIVDVVKIVTEIYSVKYRLKARRPAKLRIGFYEFGAISGIGEVGALAWNCKAPDIAFVYCGAVCFDFIDSPVVSCARNKTVRIGRSG